MYNYKQTGLDMCEDFPCCGHEQGDCEGKLYGSDEAIKKRVLAQIRSENYDPYYDQDQEIIVGNLLDVIAVDCVECNSAGFVFYGTEGTLVMPCECEGE